VNLSRVYDEDIYLVTMFEKKKNENEQRKNDSFVGDINSRELKPA
jgi:hypothetical protein